MAEAVTSAAAAPPGAGGISRAERAGIAAALPGLAAAAGVALVAEAGARLFADARGQARVPAVVIALALGAIAANVLLGRHARQAIASGLDLVKKRVLRAAIVLYGLGLTAGNLAAAGLPVLGLVAACLATSLAVAALAGRLFGTSPRVRVLLGCGTAICGATAVVTVAPLIRADDDEVAFAVATIFLFNLVALFAFPPIGAALGLSDTAFGAWVGTAVNDTSAVVATGRVHSHEAGIFATIVKVIRTLALVPLALGVAALAAAPAQRASVSVARIFPWFVLGFAATAGAAVLLPVPPWLVTGAKSTAGVLVTGVLAAVGLHLDARKVLGMGTRSLALGFTIAAVMAAVSLLLVRLLSIGRAAHAG